ncbi:hypothetical protein EMPG_11165 [Blastomyces silverae]|uniref:Uncharacterized protein n=1 Tax=Blastomyces silverae TaxID=2060906 RepID=A0A0H1B302_9EURO|nr:hypothetical protein EMPG_11165 [Blastomyces silverae]
MSEFEKTAAEKMNMNDIIKISDAEKKNNLTNILMKKTSTSFKCKILSSIMLKSRDSISTSVKMSCEMKMSSLISAKMINEIKMSDV